MDMCPSEAGSVPQGISFGVLCCCEIRLEMGSPWSRLCRVALSPAATIEAWGVLFLLDEVTLGRAETEHPVRLSFPWTQGTKPGSHRHSLSGSLGRDIYKYHTHT